MGTAASKTSSLSVGASAVRARVIRPNLSLEQVMAVSRNVTWPAKNAAVETLSVSINTHGSHVVEPVEMQAHIRHKIQRINDFEHVTFLDESTRAFEATASSHRPRSLEPVRLPTDRTAAVSSTGIGGLDEDKVQGRVTASELRTLLCLHYEKPESWTDQVLADKYGLDVSTMRDILNSVGPPHVLAPKGPSEHPLGVWFTSPGLE